MGCVMCLECLTLINLDENLEDWDFDKKVCRRCIEASEPIERWEE